MNKTDLRRFVFIALAVVAGYAVARLGETAIARWSSGDVQTLTLRADGTLDFSACEAEMKRFCPGKKWGDLGVGGCLIEHLWDISSECHERMPAFFPVVGPCWTDLNRLCRDVVPGKGRLPKCLREKGSSVSAACRDSSYIQL